METYRILVLGDFHFGESYGNAGARVLREYGYSHSTAHLRPFIDASDSVVLNLETPLVDPETSPSPFEGKKPYVHWGAPTATVNELQKLKVNAVSLANNHTLDHGIVGLESTFQALQDAGIEWFGAGRTLDEARRPYRVIVPDRVGGGEIHFHGSFQYSARYDRDFAFYANDASSGCAPLSVGDVPDARPASTRQDSLQVAFPHWGANYAWRNERQYHLAHRFLRKDYDLVLGHGGHALQEVHRKQQRWVVYGLGNGNFQSGGRWRNYEEQNGILPYSFWTVLELQRCPSGRRTSVKLYPVYSDNAFTNFQPRPVASEEFDRVVQALSTRPIRPWRFDNSARTTGTDELGHFIELDLGVWEEGKRPARLPGLLDNGDPGEWPLRGTSTNFEDRVLESNRYLGVSSLALAAESDGASVRWLNSELALLECRGKRIVAQKYRTHASSMGEAITDDKVLTAELLHKYGVLTPRTLQVNSVEGAIEAKEALGTPVVIKPRYGRRSRGVSVNLVSDDEIREAYDQARQYGADVIAQQYIEPADELRVMATPDQTIAVIKRVLPHVVGDGVSTISELITDKNQQRSLSPSLRERPIPVDSLTHREIQRHGLTLHDVIELGRTVTVRKVGGLSVGADGSQVLETTDSQVKEVASSAIAAIPHLQWGGVDVIVDKENRTPYILEINANAAYGAALFPTYGPPRNVAEEAWRHRYQAARPDWTPVPKTSESRDVRAFLPEGAGLIPEGETVAFRSLFAASLERLGYTVAPRSPYVLQIVSPRGSKTWTTRDGLLGVDQAAVAQLMRRHELVAKVLDMRDIGRTRARGVTTTARLRTFIEGRVSQVLLMPVSAPWQGPESNVLTSEEALDLKSLPQKMWVQARPPGRRIRVLATREKAWFVTTKSNTQGLDTASRRAAERLAVRAVQAVPELRWSAVDILVRPRRIREERPGGVLVEGLTTAPVYSLQDQVIAGDFDEFVQQLLQPEANEDGGVNPSRR